MPDGWAVKQAVLAALKLFKLGSRQADPPGKHSQIQTRSLAQRPEFV